MVKNKMLKMVSEKCELSQKQVDSVLSAFVDTVVETLKTNREEKINLGSLGSFKVKNVPERSGVSTLGEKKAWKVPAHDEITFKMNKNVKTI